MQSLRRLPSSLVRRTLVKHTPKSSKSLPFPPSSFYSYSTDRDESKKSGEDQWNDAWESAWLPEDLAAAKNRAHWEIDVNFSNETVVLPPEADANTKAFVEDMDENWNQRRGASFSKLPMRGEDGGRDHFIERMAGSKDKRNLESLKKDYRLKKQRIHAALWMKEIDKEEEARLGNPSGSGDIERLLDSCSELFDDLFIILPISIRPTVDLVEQALFSSLGIFDSGANELNDPKVPSTHEFKTKPDGWETTSKSQDGNLWEMSQREEDVLLQEFERRIAFSKFQIASFIKSHIFSRRRPIDGWKYMIEELGPNAKKGKGSALRLPSLSDAATQPFKEERTLMRGKFTPYKKG
ncbi:hypothetical protein ACLOJK_029023 [Asimina triloba]